MKQAFLAIILTGLLVMSLSFDAYSGDAGLFMYDCSSGNNHLILSKACRNTEAGGIVFDDQIPGETPGGIPRGVVESSEIAVTEGFDQAVVSWNSFTPPGSYLVVYLRVRIDGSWSKWYNMGVWNTGGCPEERTSIKHQDDNFGKVDADTLVLNQKADAFKVRAEISSTDGHVYPVLRMLTVNVIRSADSSKTDLPSKEVWGKELNVPELCQLSVEGGEVWCSPTSTAMVLGYWSRKLHRPDLKVGILEAVNGIRDKAWGGTGNWVFNTAYAGEFKGIRAYVTRFGSVSDLENWIAKGIPVIVSIDYNKINRRNTTNRMGHLMVLRGFTPEGDPIINDPWAHLDKGQKVRKVFKREDLEYSWLGENGSFGTVYLIHP